jgi:hypothetical protein
VANDTGYWDRLVTAAMTLAALDESPHYVQAFTPIRQLRGLNKSVVVDCDDGRRYVLKGRQVMRPLIADQVVGRLGAVIAAPVPHVALVQVPSTLLTPGSFLEHFQAGIAHGSEFIPGCIDSYHIRHRTEPGNPERFAALAVLYGWTDPEDRQYLYAKEAPHLVFSVDHGAFFTGSSDWDVGSLRTSMSADVDQLVSIPADLSRSVIQSAVDRLNAATNEVIAEVVTDIPADWGITLDERVVLAQYLGNRRDALLMGTSA